MPGSRALGIEGEAFARAEYARRGCRIIAANIFNRRGRRMGEIDFVALAPGRIIFVEVKTRSPGVARFLPAGQAVDAFKQAKLVRMAHWFIAANPRYREFRPQIDVCLVECGLDKKPIRAIIIPDAIEDYD